MSHWITSHPEFGINYLAQITASANQLLLTVRDETLKDIGAIAELKLNGIITHSFFLFVHYFVLVSIFTTVFSY